MYCNPLFWPPNIREGRPCLFSHDLFVGLGQRPVLSTARWTFSINRCVIRLDWIHAWKISFGMGAANPKMMMLSQPIHVQVSVVNTNCCLETNHM